MGLSEIDHSHAREGGSHAAVPLFRGRALRLPAMLTEIEAEAFSGVAAEVVIVPEHVTSIAFNAFPDTVE
ncbi:MAG: hypothetical protein IKE24_10655 [Clostridia bacterium]|nr:hypothetical protein [Clostridia bacterium]